MLFNHKIKKKYGQNFEGPRASGTLQLTFPQLGFKQHLITAIYFLLAFPSQLSILNYQCNQEFSIPFLMIIVFIYELHLSIIFDLTDHTYRSYHICSNVF